MFDCSFVHSNARLCAVSSCHFEVHPSHFASSSGGALRAYGVARLESVVDIVTPGDTCAAPGAAVRLPAWMQAHVSSSRADVHALHALPAAPVVAAHAVIAQLSGAFECAALDAATVLRQLPALTLFTGAVFAVRLHSALCVFRVLSLAPSSPASLAPQTVLSLRAVAEHATPVDRAIHALTAAASELLDAVTARLGSAVPAQLRSASAVLLTGARGSGKSRVLALLREALDARGVGVRSFSAVDLAMRREDELLRDFTDRSDAALVVAIDDLFAADDAAVWRALSRAATAAAARATQWCAVIASTHASLPRELAGATVLLRKPTLDGALLDSLPVLVRGLPPDVAARATALAADQLRRQRDDRGLGGHDLVGAVRRALLTSSPSSSSSQALTGGAAPAQATDSFDALPGYDAVKAELRELLVWPLLHRDALERLGVTPARGVLLEGPSGCGKTMMANALLQSLPFAVFAVKASDLLSRYLGGTERAIRELFARARRVAPSVVWLDEIDVLGASRDQDGGDDGGGGGGGDAIGRRTLSALLAELDGVSERDGVLILAATSRLSHVDSALLRPGRFDRVLRVPLPTHADRVAILASRLRRAPASRVTAEQIERIAALTDGRTGADLAALHREAAFAALHDAGAGAEHAVIDEQHLIRACATLSTT
jgi:hypothetical protein